MSYRIVSYRVNAALLSFSKSVLYNKIAVMLQGYSATAQPELREGNNEARYEVSVRNFLFLLRRT
jgi:hypothetical protein